jgi:hypothetical protein
MSHLLMHSGQYGNNKNFIAAVNYKLLLFWSFLYLLPLSCTIKDKPSEQKDWPGTMESREKLFGERLSGIYIFPGAWRPHHPFEQIAWIKPPWMTPDYIWLDFPEAIFTDQGLLFLSHLSPRFPQVFPDEPKVPWKEIEGGISFERKLPNGVIFGGSLVVQNETTVDLNLYIRNHSGEKLTKILLQTCAFLRHSKEFSAFTADNKYVHVPDSGWMSFPRALKLKTETGRYRLGWRGGPMSADLPVMVTKARPEREGGPDLNRMIAFTWDENTYSLITNPEHPCMHADPYFPDLRPGQSAEIHGRLIFHEGTIEELEEKYFRR